MPDNPTNPRTIELRNGESFDPTWTDEDERRLQAGAPYRYDRQGGDTMLTEIDPADFYAYSGATGEPEPTGDAADLEMDGTVCSRCGEGTGPHLTDAGRDDGSEHPAWSMCYRDDEGKIVCEDCANDEDPTPRFYSTLGRNPGVRVTVRELLPGPEGGIGPIATITAVDPWGREWTGTVRRDDLGVGYRFGLGYTSNAACVLGGPIPDDDGMYRLVAERVLANIDHQ